VTFAYPYAFRTFEVQLIAFTAIAVSLADPDPLNVPQDTENVVVSGTFRAVPCNGDT
jgi:hypothetical protein